MSQQFQTTNILLTLTLLFLTVVGLEVVTCSPTTTRKVSSISFQISEQGHFIFKQPIETRLYQQSPTQFVSEIDQLCEPPTQQANFLVNLFQTPHAYYFQVKDFVDFFGPILSQKNKCSVRVSVNSIDQPTTLTASVEERSFDSVFEESLNVLSNMQQFSNFHNMFGPFVATNIEYGESSLIASFETVGVGIHQLPIGQNETLIPRKQILNSNMWFGNDGAIVNFKMMTLADYVALNNLAPPNIINSLQQLQQSESVMDLTKAQQIYQSSLSNTIQICENTRMFNMIEATLDTGFQTEVIAYGVQSYQITLNQIKQQLNPKGLFSNVKLLPQCLLSLDKNPITDLTIFKVNIAASSTIRETYLTTQESEAKSISPSNYGIFGYCSSIAHPEMIPLYKFKSSSEGRHYYRTSEKGEQPGWVREELMCYVYPQLVSIPSEQLCLLN